MNRILAFLLLGIVTLSGCGYTTGSLLPSGYKTIFVKPVENSVDYINQDERKLYVPGMENSVRTAMIDRFLFDGNLHVGTQDTADLVLEAKLTGFDREELRINTNADVKEYRLRVTVSMKVIDQRENGKIMWEEPSFAGESTYYVTGPLAKSDSAALEDAVKDLAQRVVERTVQNW